MRSRSVAPAEAADAGEELWVVAEEVTRPAWDPAPWGCHRCSARNYGYPANLSPMGGAGGPSRRAIAPGCLTDQLGEGVDEAAGVRPAQPDRRGGDRGALAELDQRPLDAQQGAPLVEAHRQLAAEQPAQGAFAGAGAVAQLGQGRRAGRVHVEQVGDRLETPVARLREAQRLRGGAGALGEYDVAQPPRTGALQRHALAHQRQ